MFSVTNEIMNTIMFAMESHNMSVEVDKPEKKILPFCQEQD